MKRWLLLIACVLCWSASARAESSGYALIVTNNRSQSASRPDLHYADDDGVQYRQLFADLLGADHVVLLTQLDSESAALHPQLDAQPPTHANLSAAVQRLAQQLEQARAAGEKPVVYIVLAGHGDLDRGQGYLDLADGRLTARELDALVIARLHAERVHLMLDSCNSYFLLSPRKPGGKRWSNPHDAPRDLLAKYPHVGALLSTSAEAVTYEWSEIQSGVFSYEVRAGLRGAADLNGDEQITYAELSGFIRVANRPIVNDLYRPKVFSRSPAADRRGDDAVIAELPRAAPRRLILGPDTRRRLTLRDNHGVRLLDVHKELGASTVLTLPPSAALVVQERVASAGRPSLIDYDLPNVGEQHFDTLHARAPEQQGRGAPPLFDMLFAEPFGMDSYERARSEATAHDEPPTGVTERDAERLRLHLSLIGRQASNTRRDLAASLLLTGTIPTAALTYSVYRSSDRTGDWIDRTGFGLGVISSLTTLGIATYFLTTPWSEEALYQSFLERDFSTERARSRAVSELELELKLKAEESRRGRDIAAWIAMIGGGINAIQGGVFLTQDLLGDRSVRVASPVALLIGVGQVLFGLYLKASSTPLERAWATYAADPAVQQRNER